MWSEHPLSSIEAIGCLGLPQSAKLGFNDSRTVGVEGEEDIVWFDI
jgi:hypothetical protein